LLKKSYEFKEVLDNVVGISEELIKNKDIEENVKDELKIVYENSNRLLAITKGLNDYYILDDESIKIEQSINLRRIVEESITVLSNEIRDKNLSVENQISERIYINGDSLKLFLLITNLLENSVKNSEDFSEIEIGAIILGTVLRVNISDRGRGISVDKLLSLQSYFRDESEPEDIGLGFVLAKKIVELHGGKIELWSKEDVGTRISFVLKDAISINDRSREKLDELKREVTLDTVYGDKKILIFCNNYFNCQVLINFLKDKDFGIRIVETKGEMGKYLEQENYDILIMDILEIL
jgi:Signal transduction histidine kinase